eukprot:COSAG02_NODE_95_length_37416_cov_60.512742_17_plen_49_part_00
MWTVVVQWREEEELERELREEEERELEQQLEAAPAEEAAFWAAVEASS